MEIDEIGPPVAGDARRGKRLLLLLGVLIGGGFLTATVFGFLGGLWWPLDLASNFRPHYVVGLAVAAVLLALARAWKLALVALAGLAVNLILVLPLFVGSAASAAPDSPVLRILTFNVSADNRRIDEVIDFFEESGADLIFIFEGGPLWESAIQSSGLSYDLSPGLRSAFGFGNAILVRSGLEVELQGIPVGPNTPRARQLDMEFDGMPIRILAVHPPSPTSRSKATIRDEQLAGVAEWAVAQDRPVVVVGDLNASPWSHSFRPLAGSDLINSLNGFGLQASWPALLGSFGVPIDHLLHSAELTTITREIGPSLGSEHHSVFITLARSAGRN
jgi:endonuclease/exonuclease/phosphatase (EEP) superfamily protein YafD